MVEKHEITRTALIGLAVEGRLLLGGHFLEDFVGHDVLVGTSACINPDGEYLHLAPYCENVYVAAVFGDSWDKRDDEWTPEMVLRAAEVHSRNAYRCNMFEVWHVVDDDLVFEYFSEPGDPRESFSTFDECEDYVRVSLGEYEDDYDVHAIARSVFRYDGLYQVFRQCVDTGTYWKIVQMHDYALEALRQLREAGTICGPEPADNSLESLRRICASAVI